MKQIKQKPDQNLQAWAKQNNNKIKYLPISTISHQADVPTRTKINHLNS